MSQLLAKVTATSYRYYINIMLNVSALLLDDALKPATPMINGAINENQLIFDEVKAYKNGAKYITFNITRGVAHITFHILF